MSKYSSDSDSSDNVHYPNRKMKRRSQSSSSSSNDSHYSSKRRSYRHKRSKGHRSRSRDKYNKSTRSRHSIEGSRSIHVPSSSSKAKKSKARSRSSSKEGSRKRSTRRTKGNSRYRSSSSSSASSSSSSSSSPKGRSTSKSPSRHSELRILPLPNTNQVEMSSEEALKAKLQQAIRAAQNADNQLRQQGFLTGAPSRKEIVIKQPTASVLEEINSPSFVQKPFVSGSTSSFAPDNELIDLAKKPANTQIKEDDSSIFHPNLRVDSVQKLEKWVKKLYNLRQKAINGEPLA